MNCIFLQAKRSKKVFFPAVAFTVCSATVEVVAVCEVWDKMDNWDQMPAEKERTDILCHLLFLFKARKKRKETGWSLGRVWVWAEKSGCRIFLAFRSLLGASTKETSAVFERKKAAGRSFAIRQKKGTFCSFFAPLAKARTEPFFRVASDSNAEDSVSKDGTWSKNLLFSLSNLRLWWKM